MHNSIFYHIQLCPALSVLPVFPVLFTKLHEKTIKLEKISFFAYIAASAYHIISKEVENHIFRHKLIFRYTCMYKQHTLTNNYDIFAQMWYSYFRYTFRLFLECVLFVGHCNIIKASWETKKERLSYRKKYIEGFVRGTSLFWLHVLLSMSFFVAFPVYSLPLPKWRTCWMSHIKIHNIAMVGILCDDTMSELPKCDISRAS